MVYIPVKVNSSACLSDLVESLTIYASETLAIHELYRNKLVKGWLRGRKAVSLAFLVAFVDTPRNSTQDSDAGYLSFRSKLLTLAALMGITEVSNLSLSQVHGTDVACLQSEGELSDKKRAAVLPLRRFFQDQLVYALSCRSTLQQPILIFDDFMWQVRPTLSAPLGSSSIVHLTGPLCKRSHMEDAHVLME